MCATPNKYFVASYAPVGEQRLLPRNEATHISVVISCRNEILHVRAFLESLFRQDLHEIEMEVLVADGRSEDGTRIVLAEFEKTFASLRVIDNPERIAATGLNRAIRESRGEIILRMDVHTIYAPDYVLSCIEVLRETGADNVGGPALTRAQGTIPQAIAARFPCWPFAQWAEPSFATLITRVRRAPCHTGVGVNPPWNASVCSIRKWSAARTMN